MKMTTIVHMNIYRLISFRAFLKLIEADRIFVAFYLKEFKNTQGFDNHGVTFKIKNQYIENLFYKLISI